MCNFDAIATLTQEFIQLIGDENAAMLAAGAAHANDQLGLALVDVLGHQKVQQLLLQLQILEGLGIAADKIGYRSVITGLAAQLLHIKWIG